MLHIVEAIQRLLLFFFFSPTGEKIYFQCVVIWRNNFKLFIAKFFILTNKFYIRCYGKQTYRRSCWTMLSLFFCKMAKNPKQHKESIKFWILQVSSSPLSCVTGVSFQECQVAFHFPARPVGYSTVSPWAIHTVPWSSFFLPHQLGWSQVMLIGLVIFLYKYFLSLYCYSPVL